MWQQANIRSVAFGFVMTIIIQIVSSLTIIYVTYGLFGYLIGLGFKTFGTTYPYNENQITISTQNQENPNPEPEKEDTFTL